jgi:AcrR family transcriptional regulator
MSRPAPGTRPANRRELIVAAATQLFYEKGYSNVGMTHVAEAVAVSASALYRHFPSKQKLLEAVIEDSLEASGRSLDGTEHSADLMVGRLAADAIAHRRAAVLWRREARQIPAVSEVLQARARRFIHQVSSLLAEYRTDLTSSQRNLLAHCLVGAANSVSFHDLQLPADEFADVLTAVLQTIIAFRMPDLVQVSSAKPPSIVRSRSRREALLSVATEQFARNGYTQVSMDQIGAPVGISAAGVYTYFARKDEILDISLGRAAAWLRVDLDRTLRASTEPQEAQRRLLDSYSAFVLDHPDMVRLLLTETVYLSEPGQTRFRDEQEDYLSDWALIAGMLNPQITPPRIRITVHAVIAMMNEVAVSGHPWRYANIQRILAEIGWATLKPQNSSPTT